MQPPPQQRPWINLAELKGQLIRKLGPDRSKQYFDYLNRFLSLRISKTEFDKLCVSTIGRDNISLHNQLIHSILANTFTRKVPPVTHEDPSRTVGNKKSADGVYHQNGSIPVVTHVSSLPNGDILPPSPRKARTGARERRGGERKSALVPNGKTNYASPSSSTLQSGDFGTNLENNNLSFPDTQKPVQQCQELTRQAENGHDISGHRTANFAATQRPPDGLVAVHSKHPTESLGRKDVLCAPLGVPYCPFGIGGSRRESSLGSGGKCVRMLDTGGLIETKTLRERMEQIAATQGLQGVSMDCANVVNNGLDAYLRGLIWSFSDLNGARSGNESMQTHLRALNGVKTGHLYQIQSSSWPLGTMQEHRPKRTIPLLDFTVAMELNPQQLGEDWPIMMERICKHAFEE